MALRRLAALFQRYCTVHLDISIPGDPLLGADGKAVGHIDRIRFKGSSLVVEGWTTAATVCLTHAGQTRVVSPDLARPDVLAALPDLDSTRPGFSLELGRGSGPVAIAMSLGGVQVVQLLAAFDRRTIGRGHLALLLPFLRDLSRALPAVVRWFAKRDPADRTRVKRHLGLEIAHPARGMQPLLFLADSLAAVPADQREAARAKLAPAALADKTFTIILPVYNAMALLPEALDRVLRHTDLPWRMILIDDASPDAAIRPFLRAWAADRNAEQPGRVILLENTENKGFIGSVNAGLGLAASFGDDVVLLNSDAFVPAGWASRLMRPFLVHDNVASVTPMSNDAEIFSAPVICQRLDLPRGAADAIDAVAARIHPDAALADAPTGVGFCMALSRAYLERVPLLDHVFGRGYGEEVDWCQKTRALGGRHLGLAGLFVEHRGGTSFGSAQKQRLVAQNNAVISRRYPSYDADVLRFMAEDPLAASRLALAIGWAACSTDKPLPLYLAHNLGGGAEDYLQNRIAADLETTPVIVLRVGTAQRWQLELHSKTGVTTGRTDDFNLITRMLEPVKGLTICYSCAVGDANPIELPSRLLALRRGPPDRVEVLFHDYFPISPSYTLLDSDGCYRGLPDPQVADPAHHARLPDGSKADLAEWQQEWGRLITGADHLVVFSAHSAGLVATAFPDAAARIRIVPHQPLSPPAIISAASHDRPVIGILGNIGFQKGAAVLRALGHALAAQGTANLVVLGQFDPAYGPGPGITVHGGYQRTDLAALAAFYGIDRWLIPSIWPETFSYTTHEALATGLPVWCFDLGAQGDAVGLHARKTGRGGVLPLVDGTADIPALITSILAHPQGPLAQPKAAA